MGDSWDETSFDVSEADANSIIKHVDSDDLDKELFGGLAGKKPSKPSLLQAMKKSTGKGLFDDEESKKPQLKPAPKSVNNKQLHSTPKAVPKRNNKSEDDLLADLLGDSDYSEISQAKPAALKSPNLPKTPQKSNITPNTAQPAKTTSKKDILFDYEDDELLGMLDSEPITPRPATKAATPLSTTATTATKTSTRPTNKSSKFDDLLGRTSFIKESNDGDYLSSARKEVSTPVKRGPKTDEANMDTGGFTPSTGGRSRRGLLNSGITTPKSAALRPDDTFNLLLEEDKHEVRASSGKIEDIFRVDNEPSPIANIFRVDNKVPKVVTEPLDTRPHTHTGVPGEEDQFTNSRPPSAGRRAATALQHRNSPLLDHSGMLTPQRRRSVDSLVAEEDIPNKSLPWQAGRQEEEPKTPLPWETPADEGQAPQGSGTATQMIIQQNSVLETTISELKDLKSSLEKELRNNQTTHEDFKREQEGNLKELNIKLEQHRREVGELETKLRDKEQNVDSIQRRLNSVSADLETSRHDIEVKYTDKMGVLERRHEETVSGLNVRLEEKERAIQGEIKSAAQRLREKEAFLVEDNRSCIKQLEQRTQGTEERYKGLLEDMSGTHSQTITSLKQEHHDEIQHQRQIHKEEMCAVLSVHHHTAALSTLTEQVQLSADEVAALTAKLDQTRSVSLEERERAARVTSEYLHDLKRNLDRQQKEMGEERRRLQDVVGKMESHLREQTRQSNAAQNKLIADEARFQSLQAAWEADKADNERHLEVEREKVERTKAALLTEQQQVMEKFYTGREDIAKEKARLATASQKITEHHARGAVKQLDMESQAQAMLDKAKRDVSQIQVQRNMWDQNQKSRQVFVESLEKQRDELTAEKVRLSSVAETLSVRSREVEGYSEALIKARKECVAVQRQLAKLETELRMREEDIRVKEGTLKNTAGSLTAERELLKVDRQHLNEEGIQCPACLKYRPRSSGCHSPIRSSSPNHMRHTKITSPPRCTSPLSPLNMSILSNGSIVGSRYKYPSASVLELTGSLQRFSVISDIDKQTLQHQTDRLSRLREMDKKLLSTTS